MIRKGLGKGKGTGYKNLAPMDSHIHSLSAKGVKSKSLYAIKQTSGAFRVESKTPTKLKLEQIGGDVSWKDYGGQFIVPEKFNNGDFDYYLIVNFINMEDATGEEDLENKYVVEIQSVAPSEVSKEDMKSALSSMGIDDKDEIKKVMKNKKQLAGLLAEYGLNATVYSAEGNNANELMKEAKNQIPVITGMFGFYMDRPMNRLGNTGWDFIKGDIGFKRMMKK